MGSPEWILPNSRESERYTPAFRVSLDEHDLRFANRRSRVVSTRTRRSRVSSLEQHAPHFDQRSGHDAVRVIGIIREKDCGASLRTGLIQPGSVLFADRAMRCSKRFSSSRVSFGRALIAHVFRRAMQIIVHPNPFDASALRPERFSLLERNEFG